MSSFTVLYHLGGLIQGEKVIEPVEMTLKLANYGSNGGVRQAAGNFVANTPTSLQAPRMFVASTNALFICKNERFFYNAEALSKKEFFLVVLKCLAYTVIAAVVMFFVGKRTG